MYHPYCSTLVIANPPLLPISVRSRTVWRHLPHTSVPRNRRDHRRSDDTTRDCERRVYKRRDDNRSCLQLFHRFTMQMPVHQDNFTWAQTTGRLGTFLKKVREQIVKGCKKTERDARIFVGIEFTDISCLNTYRWHEHRDVFDLAQYVRSILPREEEKYICLYYKAQLQYFLGRMREELNDMPAKCDYHRKCGCGLA